MFSIVSSVKVQEHLEKHQEHQEHQDCTRWALAPVSDTGKATFSINNLVYLARRHQGVRQADIELAKINGSVARGCNPRCFLAEEGSRQRYSQR